MSAKYDWLIVGLGNPGREYAGTRHNIGWMVVSALCEKYKAQLKSTDNLCYKCSFKIRQDLILAALPTTFMNNSGEVVAELAEANDIPVDRIIVVADEYNFPVGKLHLKAGGSDGGHNGISSVIYWLESADFFRLRCGIGKIFSQGEMVDYVLSQFKKDEIEERDKMIAKAIESIEYIIKAGKTRGMSDINSGKLWNEEADKDKANSGN